MKASKTFKNIVLPLVLFLVIIIAFITLHPTSVSTVFTQKQAVAWEQFVKDSSSTKRMDTRKYWEMREFYSPGTFTYDIKGLPQDNAKQLLQESGIKVDDLNSLLTFNAYESPKFISYENFIAASAAAKMRSEFATVKSQKDIIASGDNFVIYQKSPQKAVIVFVSSKDEMRRTNGYLELIKDENFISDKAWLSISEVTIN